VLKPRLHDLEKDPKELVSLEKEKPENCKRLLGLLEKWTDSFPASFADLGKEQGKGPEETSEEAIQLFEDIGYLGRE
jgi:hypothetical protein